MNMQPQTLFHNRYRLEKKIGQGAFGEVWQAKDELTDTDVAIKIYIALDDNGIENFKTEFKTVYALNHQNLLRPEFYDIENSRPFLIMQLCKYSLEHQICNITERQIWKLIHDVANGLDYLHQNEIIHRDIKPDNILVSDNDNYLISDFGISTKLRSTMRRNSVRQDVDNNLAGTIAYMAPELFTSNRKAVKATDIWALGATLYEVITGELPFLDYGGSLQNKGADIPEISDDMSADLSAVITDCLAKETWERPLATELAEYANSKMKGYDMPMPWKDRIKKDDTKKTNRKTERKTVDKEFEGHATEPQNKNTQHGGDGNSKKWTWIAGLLGGVIGLCFGGLSGTIIFALGFALIIKFINNEKKKVFIWIIVGLAITIGCIVIFENIQENKRLEAERIAAEQREQERIKAEQEAAPKPLNYESTMRELEQSRDSKIKRILDSMVEYDPEESNKMALSIPSFEIGD